MKHEKRENCDSCHRRPVLKPRDFCYGCGRSICITCALTKGHVAGGVHA